MRSMAFQFVRGIYVVVHTSELPTDEEWDRYLTHALQNVSAIRGTCVVTYGGMPTASQRDRTAKAWLKTRERPTTAVLARSIFSRTIVNATRWLIGDKIKAFAPSDDEAAFAFIGMDPEQRAEVRMSIDYLKRLLAIED